MTLKVSPTRRAVIVTMPSGVRLEEANRFLSRHLQWVREQLHEVPDARPFGHDMLVPLRGVLHRVQFNDLAGVRASTGVVPSSRTVDGVPLIRVGGRAEHAPRRLRDWLVAQARKDLSDRVEHHARRLGLSPKGVSVRDPVSRWGSCSSSGQLSFSWRLIMAPCHVLDYVAAHEVAHLKEMNHSRRFWSLVRKAYPDIEQAKSWLNSNGRELHAFGRTV
jgi:hypothetical protein